MGRRQPRQREFVFSTRGGRRRNAGRKPNGERAGVSHLRRRKLSRHHPVHVTLKLSSELGYLRRRVCFAVIAKCIRSATERLGLRIVEFSVQGDHIHLLCEAESAEALSRGMQGLSIRIAKGLNKALERKGTVFADRFHAEYLTTPRQVRNAVAYVLNNHRRHDEDEGDLRPDEVDPCSSAAWFEGWKSRPFIRKRRLRQFWSGSCSSSKERPTAQPRCWLLRVGWRRYGRVEPTERPARLDAQTRRALRRAAASRSP